MAPFILLASLLFSYFASALMFDVLLSFFVALGLLGLVRAWKTAAAPAAFRAAGAGHGRRAVREGPGRAAAPAAAGAARAVVDARAAAALAVAGTPAWRWRCWAAAALILAWAIPAGVAGRRGLPQRHLLGPDGQPHGRELRAPGACVVLPGLAAADAGALAAVAALVARLARLPAALRTTAGCGWRCSARCSAWCSSRSSAASACTTCCRNLRCSRCWWRARWPPAPRAAGGWRRPALSAGARRCRRAGRRALLAARLGAASMRAWLQGGRRAGAAGRRGARVAPPGGRAARRAARRDGQRRRGLRAAGRLRRRDARALRPARGRPHDWRSSSARAARSPSRATTTASGRWPAGCGGRWSSCPTTAWPRGSPPTPKDAACSSTASRRRFRRACASNMRVATAAPGWRWWQRPRPRSRRRSAAGAAPPRRPCARRSPPPARSHRSGRRPRRTRPRCARRRRR